MVMAMMFIFLFSIGGFTGLMQGSLSTDIHVHDTAFIVAHFHYTMFGGVGLVFFAALLYWFPKMFGKMYPKKIIHLSLVFIFVGFQCLYFPLFIAGLKGMPRRYADYLVEYNVYHRFSTIGSWILVSGLLLMIGTVIYSIFKGVKAGDNPWGGKTLEWQTQTPPPVLNFEKTPVITAGPYEYPDEVEE